MMMVKEILSLVILGPFRTPRSGLRHGRRTGRGSARSVYDRHVETPRIVHASSLRLWCRSYLTSFSPSFTRLSLRFFTRFIRTERSEEEVNRRRTTDEQSERPDGEGKWYACHLLWSLVVCTVYHFPSYLLRRLTALRYATRSRCAAYGLEWRDH